VAQIPFVLADGPPEDRLRLEFLSFARTGLRRCCDAASTRGCKGRRGGERDRLAAAHGAGRRPEPPIAQPGHGRGRRRNCRFGRSVGARTATCLAQAASHRPSSRPQSRS